MSTTALGTSSPATTVTGMTDDVPLLDDAALAAALGLSLPASEDAEAVQAAELAEATGVDPDDVRTLGDDTPDTWCEHPRVMRATTASGESDLYAIACGSRLAEDCPYCAEKYAHRFRRMARGNLGLPDDPNRGLAPDGFFLFVTLTHGSCGPVWDQVRHKRIHGAASSDAPQFLGAPLDPRRYGYAAQILRHMVEPALRKSWSQAQRRWAARWAEAGYAVTTVAVREVQERGAGHIHEIVRVHLRPEDARGPHVGYWREGTKTKVTPDAERSGSFRHPTLGLIIPEATDDSTRWVMRTATGTPTAVIWQGTGATHWYQNLVASPRTDREVRESYQRDVDVTSHYTEIPDHLVQYVGSEQHLALRERLGLPVWDKIGLTDRTPAQGQIPAVRDDEGVLHPRVTWGAQVDVRSISAGGEGGAQRILAYLTKALSYVAKDIGASTGEGARAGSPRARHDRRLRLEALAMAPAVIDEAWARMDTTALVERAAGIDREHGWREAGMPMPVDDPPPAGRILELASRKRAMVRAVARATAASHRDQLVEWLITARTDVATDRRVDVVADLLSQSRHVPWSHVKSALGVLGWWTDCDRGLVSLHRGELWAVEVAMVGVRRSALRALGTAVRWTGYRGRAWTAMGRTVTIADVRAAQRHYAEYALAEQGLMPDPTPVVWQTVTWREIGAVDPMTLPRGRTPVPV